MSNEIRLTGFKEFQAKLKQMPKTVQSKADSISFDAAKQWAQLAKRAAPVDQGKLRGSISSSFKGAGISEVVSPAAHSRFVEWGTKGKKVVPSDLVSYESQLGYQKTGGYYDFLNAILDWVKRKGISAVTNSYTGKKVGGKAAKENLVVVAEAIAWSILKKGINGHPFFFPQKPIVESEMVKKMKGIFDDIK